MCNLPNFEARSVKQLLRYIAIYRFSIWRPSAILDLIFTADGLKKTTMRHPIKFLPISSIWRLSAILDL